MLKRVKYNIIHELSPQGSRAWLNWVCTKFVVKMGIKSVYRGSFRIDFLGFGSCFSLCVCVCVCVCVFFFCCIFWVFSVRFWVFFYADFLVFWLGFCVIAVGFFLGFGYDL